jgi:hypothetical protein
MHKGHSPDSQCQLFGSCQSTELLLLSLFIHSGYSSEEDTRPQTWSTPPRRQEIARYQPDYPSITRINP